MQNASTEQRYKYRLKELFISLFGCKSGDMRREFAQNQNLSLKTVKRDFNLLITDTEQIPASRLSQYALFLNTEVTALRNRLNALAA